MAEVTRAAEGLLAIRGIVRLKRFTVLRGREPELYGRVLEIPAYGEADNRAARRAIFRQEADQMLLSSQA
jgi:hypothetical protein